MAINGDVQINQGGLVPSARTLPNATALDISLVNANGDQLSGFDASRPAGSTITSVASAAVTTVLLAANPARRGGLIYNDSTKELRIAIAATASLTAFSLSLPAKGTYELPENGYTGVISGIWLAANGFARVTEVTTT